VLVPLALAWRVGAAGRRPQATGSRATRREPWPKSHGPEEAAHEDAMAERGPSAFVRSLNCLDHREAGAMGRG